jgi:UDP-N-acetylmuramoylalanine--D-glutamate ligase
MIDGATMSMAEFATKQPVLTGRRLLVVGAGKSGLAAARLAAERGALVRVADRADASTLKAALQSLNLPGISAHPNGHPASLADDSDLIILSPGVPTSIDLVQRARTLGVPVWSEIEFASRFVEGRIIGVTGSNGKSTVTTLLGSILRHAGIAGGTGGNLDTPLAALLSEDSPEAIHVVELSSFQLETIDKFRPQIAIIVNLAADHLDRHQTFDNYADAKARIFENQNGEETTIFNADDRASDRFLNATAGNVHTFSTTAEISCGTYVSDDYVTLRTEQETERLFPVAAITLPGDHNLSNVLCAALAARLVGVTADQIEQAVRNFSALSHRLQHVTTVNGVRFFDDSKATNPAAVLPALSAFDTRSVHIIIGGTDKGGDWDRLADAIRHASARVYLIGAETDGLRKRLQEIDTLTISATLDVAVRQAYAAAKPGETVLLSPGCASFDQFKGFEDRGDQFQAAVRRLEATDA